MQRQMHLLAYLKTGPTAMHTGAWRHPQSDLHDIFSPSRYTHIARVLEAARFDGCFYADTQGIPDLYQGSFRTYLQHGGQISYLDPLTILPIMAAAILTNDKVTLHRVPRITDVSVMWSLLEALGARVAIVSDGDVGLAMMAAWPGSGIDVMIGSGGTREAIVAACAMRCLGGELQCRPWVRHEDEAAAMRAAGFDPEASLSMEQLVPGREVSVAVTGISGGGLLRGVLYHNWWAETHSLVMRAQSGTVREIIAKHHVALQPDQARKVI